MRRLRVLRRDEQLLRETVRGMLSEAGFGDVKLADSYVDPPDADSFDSVLNWIEGIADLGGVVANASKHPAAIAANVVLDVVSFLSAFVQWSRAKERHEEVIRIQTQIHPERRTQVLETYRTARNLAFFLLMLTIAAWIASTADTLGLKGPGGSLEAAAKVAKFVMPAVAVLNKTVDTATIYRDTERFMIDTASYVSGPMLKQAATAAVDIVERNAQEIVSVLRASGHADIADKMKMVLDEIPEHRRWLSTK